MLADQQHGVLYGVWQRLASNVLRRLRLEKRPYALPYLPFSSDWESGSLEKQKRHILLVVAFLRCYLIKNRADEKEQPIVYRSVEKPGL